MPIYKELLDQSKTKQVVIYKNKYPYYDSYRIVIYMWDEKLNNSVFVYDSFRHVDCVCPIHAERMANEVLELHWGEMYQFKDNPKQ